MNSSQPDSNWRALLLALALAAGTATAAELPDIIGEARDSGSGETLYFEHHYCNDSATACSVFYLDPQSTLIATKTMDYSFSPVAPTLHFIEYRFARESSFTPQDPDLVVDSGFDNFVRNSWDQLEEGASVRFPLQLLGRDKPLKMKGSQRAGDDCHVSELCIDVALDSWLLGNLVDPIRLTYDREQRRLQRFQGLSNLLSDQGKRQQVDISYRYAPSADQLTSR